MLDARAVPTEYTHGVIAGVDYGSKARVVMRSPTGFLFVARGFHYVARGRTYLHDIKTLADKCNRETLNDPKVRARIVELMGEGADEAALLSLDKRGFGTVLFNGGGTRLQRPGREQAEITQALYEQVTPTQDLTPQNTKKCLQCGKPLRLRTIRHRFASPDSPHGEHPKTLDELQRLTNYPIVAVRGFGIAHEPWWPYIDYFETWDGESYEQDTFCSDRCAAIYGRRAAAELAPLPEGGEPPKQDWEPQTHIDHYDKDGHAEWRHKRIEESFARYNRK